MPASGSGVNAGAEVDSGGTEGKGGVLDTITLCATGLGAGDGGGGEVFSTGKDGVALALGEGAASVLKTLTSLQGPLLLSLTALTFQ
jgi:hypothetical protein